MGGVSLRGSQTERNILTAFARESQARNRYSFFASAARKEGFVQIAEKQHEKRYLGLLANVERGTVFKKESPVVWRCRNCGYLHEGREAPAACPACAHPRAHFDLLAENW